jgi:transcriptional regulator with XRE-family HTH domain
MNTISRHSPSTPTKKQSLSSILLQERTKHGMTRIELAGSIGIDEEELTRYELGLEAIPASVLFLIAVCFGDDPMIFFNIAQNGTIDHSFSETGEAKTRLLVS